MLLKPFNQWTRHILLHHFRTAPGNAVVAPAMIVHLPSPGEECGLAASAWLWGSRAGLSSHPPFWWCLEQNNTIK